ncbi:MAG: hypothetical protein K2J73_00990 [Oscillospiraceae bacterium]|nr:hypothetical protein [Oscillospiraceae bacterium]
MDIVDKLQALLNKNMNFASIEKELKMGNGIIGKWRKQSPSCDKISKVANYSLSHASGIFASMLCIISDSSEISLL